MATITVTGRNGLFPVGTSVGLYPAGALPHGSGNRKGPAGSPIVSATVAANGVLTFTDPLVVAETPYVAYANVGGEHNAAYVRSSSFAGPQPTWKSRVAARRAAIGTS
jgi:hypothetical protein